MVENEATLGVQAVELAAIEEHPFDKVMLVSNIAGLQMHVASLKEHVAARDAALAELTGRLLEQSLIFKRAVSLTDAKVAETFLQLTAWLSPEDASRWHELIQKKDIIHGLRSLSTALILEVVNGPGSFTEEGATAG